MERVIKPIVLYSELFLMVPFVFPQLQRRKLNVWFAFRVTLVLLLLGFALVTVRIHGKKCSQTQKNIILRVVKFVYNYTKVPIIGLLFAATHFRGGVHVAFLKKVRIIEQKFKALGTPVVYDFRFAYVLVAISVLMSLVYFLGLLYDYDFIMDTQVFALFMPVPDYVTIITLEVWFVVPMLYSNATIKQWVIYQYMLRKHFRALNEYLKTAKRRTMVWTVTPTRMVSELPFYKPSEVMKNAYTIYNDLIKQAYKLNTAFGWQIFIIVPNMFITLIFAIFSISKSIKTMEPFGTSLCMGIGYYIIMLLWIVVPCSLTMAESVKFVSILRKLEMESHNDRKVDGMMSLMCLQCHHLPVEFSAVGVFELNMSLLYTIWGAMTTFLVMLLQFDI